MNEMQELRAWCEAEPAPAPSRLTGARDRLDAAIAREAGMDRPVTPGRQAALPSRRWPRWATPLVAAAAVIAVITGTEAVFSGAPGAPGPIRTPTARSYPGLVALLSVGGIVTVLREGRALAPIHVERSSDAIAVTPDGKTAYVAATRGQRRRGVVIPIQLATGKVLRPILVGIWPNDITVTANGKTAYVTNFLSGTVTPIVIATNIALTPIKVGSRPDQVVTAPDGRTLYVFRNQTLTPISTATGAARRPIPIQARALADSGHWVAVTPDSSTVYVAGYDAVLRIRRDHALAPIAVPQQPDNITLVPGGKTAYAVSVPLRPAARHRHRDTITPINLTNGTTLPPLMVRSSVRIRSNGWGTIAIAPDGKTAYFLDTLLGAVTPIHVATQTVGKSIRTGMGSYTMLFGHGASIGYLIESQQVVPLNIVTNTTMTPIKLPRVMGWGEATQR